jgi:putative phosphoribosyl transferase
MQYADRSQAGQLLAKTLPGYANKLNVWVLGLPRGGVPVAYEVAKALQAKLDVLIVRKLGTPGHTELAMGAIASGGGRVLNQDVLTLAHITPEQIEQVEAEQQAELQRREQAYRGSRPFPALKDKTVILVDDGLATGATMKAAVASVKAMQPAKLIVAVPVGPVDTVEELRAMADEVICLLTPPVFYAVGEWYQHFPQTSDDEVKGLLAQANLQATQA